MSPSAKNPKQGRAAFVSNKRTSNSSHKDPKLQAQVKPRVHGITRTSIDEVLSRLQAQRFPAGFGGVMTAHFECEVARSRSTRCASAHNDAD
jgi:hypothetical protein